MATLLIATRNAGKLEEISRLIAGASIQTVSLADVGVDREVDETGETFEANSTLKASTYARLSGLPTLADDSGLEVDALGGEPGVRSSRYAGDDATDADRVAFLLGRLQNEGRGPWRARFRCVIAIAWRHDDVELHAGVCEGVVIDTPRGSNGFGYDPVFLIPDLGRTMAELSPAEKNRVSHRGMAVRKAAAALRSRSL
jgi:XTP/dITP diphosphohydrolase